MYFKKTKLGLMLVIFCIASITSVFARGSEEPVEGAAGQVKVVEWVIKDEKGYNWTGELDLWKLVKEVANIQIKAIPLPPDAAEEKLNVMIASGDIADIVTTFSGGQVENFKLMGPKGVWMPVSDNFDLVPNLKVSVDKYPVAYEKNLAADSKLYFMPHVSTYDVTMRGVGILIRDDLLRKGGMQPEDIKTMEDLDKALTVMKTHLGSPPFGLRDFHKGRMDAVAQMMGTSMFQFPWYNPDSEQYENQFRDNPRTKEVLALLAKWYKTGILHPEFATMADKIWEGKLWSAEFAISFEGVGRINEDHTRVNQVNPEYSFTVIPWPSYKGKNYPLILSGHNSSRQMSSGPFISAKTKAKKEIFTLFNHQYDPNNVYMWWLGPKEGVHFVRRPDGTLARPFTSGEAGNEGNLHNITQVWGIGRSQTRVLADETVLFQDRWYTREENLAVAAYEMMKTIPSYEFPFVEYGDTAAEAVGLRTDMGTYLLENIVNFINNNKSVEKDWDAFLQGLEQIGASRLVEIFNKGKV